MREKIACIVLLELKSIFRSFERVMQIFILPLLIGLFFTLFGGSFLCLPSCCGLVVMLFFSSLSLVWGSSVCSEVRKRVPTLSVSNWVLHISWLFVAVLVLGALVLLYAGLIALMQITIHSWSATFMLCLIISSAFAFRLVLWHVQLKV
jgi:hypothetical protein